jgi:hypothetical protein
LVQPRNVHARLLFSAVILLLLAVVIYSSAFLQKGLAASGTHIVAAGDWGCSKNTEKTVKLAQSMNPQLLLALGDYSYEKTATCWLNLIKPVESITKINIGITRISDSPVNSYLINLDLQNNTIPMTLIMYMY